MTINNSWKEFAACKNADVSSFFPNNVLASNKSKIAPILSMCDSCPVAANCLLEAFQEEHYGIWGRTTLSLRNYYLNNRPFEGEIDIHECQSLYNFLKDTNNYPTSRNSSIDIDSMIVHSNE